MGKSSATGSGKRKKADNSNTSDSNVSAMNQSNGNALTLADIAEMINSSRTQIQSSINEAIERSKADIELLINNKIDTMYNECKTIITAVDQRLTSQVNMNAEVAAASADNAERVSKLCELRIIGIPWSPTEDLSDIFNRIASIVGYDISSPLSWPFFYRTTRIEKTTGVRSKQGSIILQFVAECAKSNFYGSYLRSTKSNKLTLRSIGYDSNLRIYVSENLSKLNKTLFDEAYALKKANTIHQVYTANGIVQIRFKEGAKPYSVRNSSELKRIVSDNALSNNVHQNHQTAQNHTPHPTPTTSTPNKEAPLNPGGI